MAVWMWKYALVVMGELIRYPCDANPRRVRQYVVGPVAVDVWCDDGLEESYGQQLVTWELPLRIISPCHGPRELPRRHVHSSHRNPAPTRSCFGKGFTPHLSSASMGSIGLCDTFMQCGYCWWPLRKRKALSSIFRIPRNYYECFMFCEIGTRVFMNCGSQMSSLTGLFPFNSDVSFCEL